MNEKYYSLSQLMSIARDTGNQCEGDGWYSYIPDDDFFCGNGERLHEGGDT